MRRAVRHQFRGLPAGCAWRTEVCRRYDGLHVQVQGSRERIAKRANDGLVRFCMAVKLVRCTKVGIYFGNG